ncbi:ABC transporter substrate-binding protein [Halalkalirubrum salinum]|uniref:ABC transporter substrate-binding protein n=1 Tax=Halalkalirubrum salinum TaxID=2563889 RepID=UPI0010FAF46C|nr:ABC transporter substrate-binding protein [Halalkalirubrum salinum]
MSNALSSTLTRRSLLAAGGAFGVLASAGCVRQARNVAGRDRPEQLSLDVKTIPGDAAPFGLATANRLVESLNAVGIDAQLTPLEPEEFYRQVLINHNFDIYVGQFPEQFEFDPDALYPLSHSMFDAEPGWQNPFGFTNLECNDLLEAQRAQSGGQRRETVFDLQEHLARTAPFVPIALIDQLTAIRTDQFDEWNPVRPTAPLGLLGITRVDDETDTLRLASNDQRITVNRNPIAAEFRRHGAIIGLLYDPLTRRDGDELIPWLAQSVDWDRRDDGVEATVSVRPDLSWHDGTEITADDIAFTYQFLTDTSLGNAEDPIPTSKYRGRSSLVSDVVVESDRSARISFDDVSREIAPTALTVPLLPEHVWADKTGPATIAGIEVNSETTEAVVWNNPEPVGSGPLRFESATDGERAAFELFDEHFLVDGRETTIPEPYGSGPAFDRLEIQLAGTDSSAVELVSIGDADATLSTLGPGVIPRIREESALDLIVSPSHGFYHLGFNTRRSPLGNPHFRRTVAQLLDKAALVADVTDDFGEPITSPVAGTEWLAPSLEWDGRDPIVPFFDDGSGELNVTMAREQFTEHGFQFNDEDELVVRNR